MAYEEDRKSAVLWEKIRWGSLVVGVSLWMVERATKHDLTLFIVGAWLFAAVAAVIQARALKRMGRSTGALYLYALFVAVLGISHLF